MKKGVKNKLSIQWSLIALVMTCWILPLMIISGTMGYYITQHINKQVMSSINNSVDYSVGKCSDNLDTAINSSRMISYDETIKNSYNDYLKDSNEVRLYDRISEVMSRQYKYDNNFFVTLMYFKDNPERIYFSENPNLISTSHGFIMQIHQFKDESQPIITEFADTLGTKIGFINVNNEIYMVRNIVTERKYNPYAVLVMKLNLDKLFESFTGTVWGRDVTVWLNDVEITLKGDQILIDQIDFDNKSSKDYYKIDKLTGIIYSDKSYSDFRMAYAIRVDKSLLMQDLTDFQLIMLFISILIVPLLILVVSFFYNNVTRPLDTFLGYYRQIENGHLGIQMENEFSNKEFDYLRNAFNEMSVCLKYQFDKIYMEELALKDAKLMALQSQINPHFLNNTLEIINWEARMGENDKVSRMIESLSTLLDAAMDRKGKPIITVEEEMLYVDAYLYIIRERLGRRLNVEINVDDECMQNTIPRLIMQPIIENAAEHGIVPKQEGTISIRINKNKQFLVIEVENDGQMSEEDEEKIKKLLTLKKPENGEKSVNLGIRNVYQRIKIIYGETADLSIKMNSFGHAVVRIIIPNNQSEQ